MKKLSQEEFLQRSIVEHGDNYDYKDTVYVNSKTPVSIFCKACQKTFTQPAKAHIIGYGCWHCGVVKARTKIRSNTLVFVGKGQVLYPNGEYSFELVDYVNSKEKVTIICNKHNAPFATTPNNFLQGQGCPLCSVTGYKNHLSGHLYVLTCGDITKIGITNGDPVKRAKEISKAFGCEFNVLFSARFENGEVPPAIEKKYLVYLRSNYVAVSAKFNGSTECFIGVRREELIAELKGEVNEIF